MRFVCRFTCLGVLMAASISCTTDSPPPQHVRAGSRLGWDQVAEKAGQAAALHFVLLIDNVESDLRFDSVSCGDDRGPKGFACSGVLPAIVPGPHTLQVSARTPDGKMASAPSPPIAVIVE